MNKEQFADILNGRQYNGVISKEEEQLAKENGLLVCYGDDIYEWINLRGIIHDDIYSGFYYDQAVLVYNKDKNISATSKNKLKEFEDWAIGLNLAISVPKCEIHTEYLADESEYTVNIKSDLPYATFDTMIDDEKYCRGIVIEESDIKKLLRHEYVHVG